MRKLALLIAIGSIVACGDKAETKATPTATVTAAATVTAVAAPAKPPPDELDVAPLDKALACGGKTSSGPCRVVDGFKNGKSWSGQAPSGDARYIGHGYTVSGGKITEEVTIIRARTVPTGDVAAGQLAVKIAFEKMPDEPAPRKDAAEKAIRAFQRHDVPTKGNSAVAFVNELKDFRELNAMHTGQKRVVTLGDELSYIAEGGGQALYVVRAKSNGDGFYAEVWPTSW